MSRFLSVSLGMHWSINLLRGLISVLLIFPSWASAEIKVLASIKPLALIAQEITGGHAKVDVLLPIKASPHDYPLRVSDIRRLQGSDIVLWIGPSMEAFLHRPLNNILPSKRITAYELPGMHWPEDEQLHSSAGQHHHHHHEHDPHLWLDPRNAIIVARALAEKLSEIDSESAAFYKNNAEQFSARMLELDQRLLKELKPISGKGFAVYHEGYLHFVARYQLQQLAYITFTPERRPGAKHLYELRQQLKNRAHCLFTEPYYDMGIATELAQELDVKIATLDPIGGDQVLSYQQLLEEMAQTFLTCLANPTISGEI